MADVTVTDIQSITKTGASTSKFARSTTPASSGTAVASTDVAVIPGFNPLTDSLLLGYSAATPVVALKAVTTNKHGRTNDMTWTAATGAIDCIPPGALSPDIFIQANGSLRITVSTGSIYVTVLRCQP